MSLAALRHRRVDPEAAVAVLGLQRLDQLGAGRAHDRFVEPARAGLRIDDDEFGPVRLGEPPAHRLGDRPARRNIGSRCRRGGGRWRRGRRTAPRSRGPPASGHARPGCGRWRRRRRGNRARARRARFRRCRRRWSALLGRGLPAQARELAQGQRRGAVHRHGRVVPGRIAAAGGRPAAAGLVVEMARACPSGRR